MRWLFAGCWWSHEYVRERDDAGRLILRCERCHAVRTPFQQEIPKGLTQQKIDPGAVRTKAVRVTVFRKDRKPARAEIHAIEERQSGR